MYLFGVALHASGDLLLRLFGQRAPKQRPWHPGPGGFRAEPRPGLRVVFGVLVLLGTVLTALCAILGNDGATRLSAIVSFGYLCELVRSPSDPILVNPTGVSVGRRLYPWSDVHHAYLVDDVVELRVPPRWIPWFGDRRVHIYGRAYLLPAAEIHWLIQHYLRLPAERERMDRLPTRAYELRA